MRRIEFKEMCMCVFVFVCVFVCMYVCMSLDNLSTNTSILYIVRTNVGGRVPRLYIDYEHNRM